MLYEGIDLVVLATWDTDKKAEPFERLGLVVSPTRINYTSGAALRLVPVGGPDNMFCIEILGPGGPELLETTPIGERLRQTGDTGLSRIFLTVNSLDDALSALTERGVKATMRSVATHEGQRLYEIAMLEDLPDAATPIGLVEYTSTLAQRHAQFATLGQHALPLKRLDHLAAVAPDLDRSCRFWDEVLGVPTIGEVVSPTVVVRQLRIGDAILELLGPSSPDSPIRQRPPGLGSSCSFEVADLEAAIAHARARGFTVPDHRIGTLPGTIVTTISAEEMSGINFQLLQYI